ncbi:MAG: isoleucine--tRNA ligase [Halobacteriota archaeon]
MNENDAHAARANSQLDFNFVAMEETILKEWDDRDIISKSINANKGAELFRFIEGPPTANGSPGVHHVYARVIKDLFLRYKSMRGFYVPRVSGWDCHGLPVEISVEKELQFEDKARIEGYGIERFNNVCRSSVFSHIDEWAELTKRIGFFIDLTTPYTTMDPHYIESVWWSLKQLWERDLIYEGHYVVPYCPRCGTALSTHEVAQGYETITEEAAFVKFPLSDQYETYFLAWTTTPWTLLSNVALAVSPNILYVKVKVKNQFLIFAKELLETVLSDELHFTIVAEFQGNELSGTRYVPLFGDGQPTVVLAEFVNTAEGTGIVHIAPAFGEDDFNVAKAEGLPLVQLVKPDGRFDDHVPLVGGLFFTDANATIVKTLASRGLLYKREMYEHSYPFCWRCEAPLMYYARRAWFIRMSSMREALVRNNEMVQWHPKTVKHGRFGNFIENARDWALSRERYWGTPLPIWKCLNNHVVFIGSIDELKQRIGDDATLGDIHKPYIDRIVFPCDECAEIMSRIPDVIDCWYDSGCAPFASLHYPFERNEDFKLPVDFVAEGVDQTRGWFYSLHAIASAVFGSNAYSTAISLGHIVDEHGRKMSKSKGNTVDPWQILNNEGADSLRWYLFGAGNPGTPKRFYEDAIIESQRKTISTIWHILSFFMTYAQIDQYDVKWQLADEQRNIIDRWLLSRLNGLVSNVVEYMDRYDYYLATLAIDSFIGELSNWFVRTSRRRFWKNEQDLDKTSAYVSLFETLWALSALIAPFAPFISEYMHKTLARYAPEARESVHLEAFPAPQPERLLPEAERDMDYAKRIVEAGRAARSSAHIKTRQPLRRIICIGPELVSDELQAIIKNELNVKAIDFEKDEDRFIAYEIGLNFATVGPKYKDLAPKIKQVLSTLAPHAVLEKMDRGIELEIGQTPISLSKEDLTVSEKVKCGFVKSDDSSLVVFLDTEITAELRKESLAREVVRRIQVMRKELDLPYAAKIRVAYSSPSEVSQAIRTFDSYLKDETLATSIIKGDLKNARLRKEWTIDGHQVVLSIAE